MSTGQDVLIGATRPAPGRESDHAVTTAALLAGLARTGVRLLLVGGAAELLLPDGSGRTVLDDPQFPADWRPVALACNEQLALCRADSTVDWTYLSPPCSSPARAPAATASARTNCWSMPTAASPPSPIG
ncbi:hypothetical protein BX265_7985 [Streptomyces sp. TLI_235]|nr:hypothetical protein [Streptomyces sp. TLI_235]PBC67387.1 hypothetical protein BX265_7985 [Streptomyces sp. TLI_235]